MSNDALWCGRAATDIHDEPHDQVGEVQATVESVGERTKVAIAVLAVPEGFVGTGAAHQLFLSTAAMGLGGEDDSSVVKYFAALVGLALPAAKEPQP